MVLDSLEAGGAETSVVDSLTALHDRDVDIELVTLRPLGRTKGLTPPAGVVVKDLSHLPRGRRLWELRQHLRDRRPDLVHTMLFAADVVGRTASLSLGLPCVGTLANDQYGPEHRHWSRYGSLAVRGAQGLDMLTARSVRRFHAISETVRDSMARRMLIDKERIDVVYRGRSRARLGVRSEERRSEVRQRLGVSDGQTLVLHPARYDYQKGVDLSVRAFGILSAANPDLDPVLLIAGRPGTGEDLLTDALRAHRGARVQNLGERSDVPDLMCAADVLSFPSRWEGLGGTLLEALALELPIVTSDLPAIREACGDAAEYVRPEDVQSLGLGLKKVLTHADLTRARVKSGTDRFERLFSIEAAADGMRDFYDRSLSARAKRR